MLTKADDFENLRAKLVSLGYTGEHRDDQSVIQALIAVRLTLETLKLSKDAEGAILDLLRDTEWQAFPDTTEDSWQDFDYGNVKLFDFVRIKSDAYDSDSGAKHNGLVGILTDMRGGQCTVKYLGLASRNSQRHPMDKLDSLKAVYNRRPSENT